MKVRSIIFAIAIASVASFAQAQATRTWVSGVGDDANPCSRTAPCKTFAGAISKTADGGEIDVLDPGGFGAVTITKNITIDGHPFQAGVLVSGTNGIVISAATNATINLRNLNIVGLGTGLSGVKVIAAGNVNVSGCTITQFTTAGIQVNGNTGGRVRLDLYDNLIFGNSGDGVQILPTLPQFVALNMNNNRVFQNTGNGVNIATNSSTTASLTHNVLSNNANAGTSNGGLTVQAGNVIATDNDISQNPFGVFMIGGTLRMGFNTMTQNTTDALHISGGTINSFGDNYISGNAGNEIPNGSAATKH